MKKILLSILFLAFIVPFIGLAQTANQTLLQSLLQQLLQLQTMLTQLIARQQTNPAVNNPSNNKTPTTSITEKRSGIIKSVYSVAGRNWMNIDYIDWNPNWKPGGQSGPAYTNVNPQLRTFEIAPNAKIVVGSIGSGGEGERAISYDKFVNYFRAQEVNGRPQYDNYLYANPWDIEVVNGVVTNIKEHYLPWRVSKVFMLQ